MGQDRFCELHQRFREEPLVKAVLPNAQLFLPENGIATVCTPVEDGFLVAGGFVQGGITTVIADFAGVYAAMSKIPAGHTPAVTINIHFLRPISKPDEYINAAARVVNESKNSLLVNVEVNGADGKLKAFGTILFAKPRT